MNYSVRNGYVVEVWQIWYQTSGFKYCILVEGTEPEMQEYVTSEFGHVGRYHALSERDIQYAEKLNIPIYIAPKINN